jgi:hypothetical protein
MKAIVVGRHAGDIPGVEVVRQINLEWSLEEGQAFKQLDELMGDASAEGAKCIVLQNVPGVLAAALTKKALDTPNVPVYVIISKPGARTAGVSRSWTFYTHTNAVADVVKFANGRAKVEISEDGTTITVTVDPIPVFEFVRLERVL